MMVGQPQLIKEVNIDIIHKLIFERGPISKPKLSKITNLSLPTVNKIVDILENDGVIKQQGSTDNGVGRKAKMYIGNNNLGNIIALYFLNDSYRCCLVDILGNIIKSKTFPVETGTTSQAALDSTFHAIDHMINLSNAQVKAIGIGVPGVVMQDDRITSIPNIAEWENINLKQLVEQRYGVSTYVENDVKLTTIGYYHTNLKEKYDNMVYFYIGKGLGSGVIINQRLLKGFSSFAGELGYLTLDNKVDSDKPGHYASKGGWLELEIQSLVQRLNSCAENELEALQSRYDMLVACAMANFIVVLNPDIIVLRGTAITEQSLEKIRCILSEYIPRESIPQLIYCNSDDYGISGIISMCLSNISVRKHFVVEKGV
ncbi:ROK family transcriptional regulator [Hydrogenoanaerobacterium sp.]|uniref:ROK family transcriptional regulator n=1 Tax=Hydrogenoanaerobacterium sp. TaxID=2953763 RepID=UPI0028976B04|nr:ROK family transcriptional regulator [Hydrogenoanaerobacterium sp.]